MKQAITLFFTLLLMCSSAFALVEYKGMPSFPYLVYGTTSAGAQVEITNQATGYSEIQTANNEGYWQTDGMNWLTSSVGRTPVMYGDILSFDVITGCGTGDICHKELSAMEGDNNVWARVDFTVTGDIPTEPEEPEPESETVCPECICNNDCNCPICDDGDTVVTSYCSESTCRDKYPCDDCETCDSCPEPQACEDCAELCKSFCDVCEEPPVCEECPEVEGGIAGVISFIIALILSIGGGLKIYKNRAGGVTMLHRHKGIIAYHDPDTQHRKVSIRHAKLSTSPKQYAEDIKKINAGIEL